ncbi:MAG: MerR family transcriptional regulator [Mycobacteriales bacterium]|nr:MerR family transcriptional regulator [Frankia sp.]
MPPQQDVLFVEGIPADDVGYRPPTACAVAGISYRQLDYWARTNFVLPTIRDASGSGTQRLYSFRDIALLKVVKRLLDSGVSLQKVRAAVDRLRERGVSDLSDVTLMSDGNTIYECTSDQEVIDLVRGGQGVFGIAVDKVIHEVEGTLAALPGERADVSATEHPGDELASRRRRRTSA